ncbi:MAG: response regulator [Lentimicrobiaceae bacterium]|nr:response regulator [Lentimicrobiaceae bacterium]
MTKTQQKATGGGKPRKILFFEPSLHIGVGKGLFIWFLLISFIPLATVSYINYMNAFKGLTIVAEKSLVTTSKLRAENINTFFTEVENSLLLQIKLESNADFFSNLYNEFEKSGKPAGVFVTSDSWNSLTTQKRKELAEVRDINDYYDFLFIDKEGNILFSLNSDNALGKNINNGTLSQTLFAKTCKKILANEQPAFSDLEKKENATISGMLGNIINDPNGNVLGVLAIEITMGQINRIIQDGVGLGETGIAFVIGEDRKLRSATRFEGEDVILTKTIKNENAKRWEYSLKKLLYGADLRNEPYIDGKVSAYANNDNIWVYGIIRTITSLEKLGVHWAVIEEINHSESFANTKELARTVKISIFITVFVVFIIAIIVTKRFVNPLKELSAWAKQVARGELVQKNIRAPRNEVGEMKDSFNRMVNSILKIALVSKDIALGDFDKKVEIHSDQDVLAIYMNQMIDSFRSVVAQANSIAKGDFSANISPRSEHDTLGIALYDMTRTLRDNTKTLYEQDWLKTGLSEMSQRMSGKKDYNELANEIISFLVQYNSAQLGLFYKASENNTLTLEATFAFYDKDNKYKNINFGDGLAGQVAREKKALDYINENDNLPTLNLGIGEVIPSYFYAVPFSYENELAGVIQLGSMTRFTELQIAFLDSCMERVAVAVNAAQSHTKLQQLYLETQEQKEKLQVQQEELRQTNEELEEQTKALRISEETLQAQKEELSVVNEELEERTRALEREKDKIKVKNSELEKAGQEIEKKARDLEQASRYKSEFLANMSHELRTPLNSILVLSQLIADNSKKNLEEKQIEFAKTIHSSGTDLLTLINEILDLSKVEAGKLELNVEKIYIGDLVVQLEKTFKPVATNKKLDFTCTIAPEIPETIESDWVRIHQILKNLLSNSLKFTNKGKVSLEISRPNASQKLNKKGLTHQNTIAFSVSDTGIGIQNDKLKLIFDAFQQADGTTSRKYGGTGLGLSISKNFADLLGGEITVESKEGMGTIFTLILPEKCILPPKETSAALVKTEEKEKPASVFSEIVVEKEIKEGKPQLPEVHDDKSTIRKGDKVMLIIEDDLNFARVLYDLASAKGFKCLIAPDGETGLHYAIIYKPSAITLDIGLPGINGWEVMDTLKSSSETRHIPVYFISASDKNVKALKMGAIGYLTKPVSLDQLNKAFEKIEKYISNTTKKLLIIDDEAIIRKSIIELIGSEGVETTAVENGNEAFEILKKETFDCIILDLGLKDMSGFDLLEQIRKQDEMAEIPVIVYTGKELTHEDEEKLQKYADSIIIKGARSPERLLAETSLFLHRMEASMPEKKRQLLKLVHDKDAVFKGKKILIVDDDMRNVFALTSVLEAKEIRIMVGKNGKEGIEKLNANPDVDLVLMDIMMPEMDGYEAMRTIRKDSKFLKLPIIALTAKAMKDDREKCIAAGANDYMTKPFDTEKLLSLLRVWLYH